MPNPEARARARHVRGCVARARRGEGCVVAPVQAIDRTESGARVLVVGRDGASTGRSKSERHARARSRRSHRGDARAHGRRPRRRRKPRAAQARDRRGAEGRHAPPEGRSNVAFLPPQSVLHRRRVPDRHGRGADQRRAHAGRSVSRHQHPAGRRRDVLQRDAAGADRDRHHRPVRAVLHARRGHRSHGVAVAARREHHQGVLSARHERRLRRHRDLEPRDGRPPASAAGHAAAGRAEVRRVEPARLPHHAERRGPHRDATARHRASSPSATSLRASPARPSRSRLAASTGRSWCTSIRRSCRRTR